MAAPRQITETEFFLVYYDIFVRNAFGNYRDVLREVGSHLMALTNSACRAKSGYTTTTKAVTPGLPPFATTTGIAPLRDNNQACHTGVTRGSPPFVTTTTTKRVTNAPVVRIYATPFATTTTKRVSNGPVVHMYARAAARGLVLANDGVLPDVPAGHELRVPGGTPAVVTCVS